MERKKRLACCELPEHLEEEILTWLPVECLYRFRSVSKQWNALISSTKFITTKWAEAPPNRMPWLVVKVAKLGRPKLERPNFFAYCFVTQVWKETSSISLPLDYPVNFCDSSAGLILLENDRAPFTVCNPLTRTSLELPPTSSIRTIKGRGIVAGEGDSPDTYKVVAMGLDSQEKGVTEIYDSSKKSWRTAPHRPEHLNYIYTPGSKMVFWSGSFYYLRKRRGIYNIVGFSISDGTSISVPLPKVETNSFMNYPGLIVCGSHLLVWGDIVKRNKRRVIIWEFEKVNVNSSSSPSRLKEIGRMPPSMCEGVNRLYKNCPYRIMKCVGVKDCACFMDHLGTVALEVVVYNVNEKTWSWLPSHPLDFEAILNIMAFQPRPDMKVK